MIGTLALVCRRSPTAQEAQIGRQVAELAKKGEILHQSHDYALLNPIAQKIKRVADPQYNFPFQFIVVHETVPNAFAVPETSTSTESLMKFVKKRDWKRPAQIEP